MFSDNIQCIHISIPIEKQKIHIAEYLGLFHFNNTLEVGGARLLSLNERWAVKQKYIYPSYKIKIICGLECRSLGSVPRMANDNSNNDICIIICNSNYYFYYYLIKITGMSFVSL